MKSVFIISVIAWSVTSCHRETSSGIKIPRVLINAVDNNFTTRQGVTYYHQQPFSGWQYALYENADTALMIPFLKGKESGIAKRWYPGKKLSEKREYENGKK